MKYKVDIIQIGSEAHLMIEDRTLILFNDSAPESLKPYCIITDKNKMQGQVKAGDTVTIGNKSYKVTVIGNVANKNLYELGHVTLCFDGAKESLLPGNIHLTPDFEGSLPNEGQIRIE